MIFPISRQGLQDIAQFLIAGAVVFLVLALVTRYREENDRPRDEELRDVLQTLAGDRKDHLLFSLGLGLREDQTYRTMRMTSGRPNSRISSSHVPVTPCGSTESSVTA